MFTVMIYHLNGTLFDTAEEFDTFDEACEYADELVETGLFLADIITPKGKVICVN